MKVRYRSALGAFASLMFLALGCVAAEKPATEAPAGGTLDKVWTITAKKGMEVQFTKAFAAHVQWRRDHKDPWVWEVYFEVDGPEAGTMFARSGNHTWEDFDAYEPSDFNKQANEQWDTTVAPYVGEIHSWISEFEPAVSHWPKDAPVYQLFQLDTYHLKPGAEARFVGAVGEIVKALTEAKWPHDWAFMQYKTGPLPSQLLVIPALNWAGLKKPDPDVFAAVVSVRGAEKAQQMFDAFSACVAHIDGIIVQRLPDLTVQVAQ